MDYQGDLKNFFDLVIFRGNSTGHFNAFQHVQIFKNLYSAVKHGGKIIFDFRDGERYFADKSLIENLGSTDDTISFYEKSWPRSIEGGYRVVGKVKISEGGKERYLPQAHLTGYFTRPDILRSVISSVGFKNYTVVTDSFGESLEYLRTFIAEK